MIDKSTVDELASALCRAQSNAAPIGLLSERHDLQVGSAYAVQFALVDIRRDGGQEPVGYKVGLTSEAVRELLGATTPDYGHVFEDMVIVGTNVENAKFLQPQVEPEIVVTLKEPLTGPNVSSADVAAVTEHITPAFEIADTRYGTWDITLADSIADNASAAALILGRPVAWAGQDLAAVNVVMSANGEVVGEGAGSAVLGDPLRAVAWLANALSERGLTLEPEMHIATGSIVPPFRVSRNDRVSAYFGALGTVSVEFD